nr:hypothetical protein [Tanacetum cinerariifolium]
MVAFLSKPTDSDGFKKIVDFLNAHPIRYALTVNPTIYIYCIEQFWSTDMAKTINEEAQLHARVDSKKIIITEAPIRRDLQLTDEEGVECLLYSKIFEQFALMGPKTTAWNEFNSTVASAIICLATNQKFNFSKWIFDSMIRNLDNVSGKFLMYPRKPTRKVTQVPQPSDPMEHVTDDDVHKELGDSLVRAATTTSSLEAEHDSGNIAKTQSMETPNESSSKGLIHVVVPDGEEVFVVEGQNKNVVNITTEELTLAQVLEALKTSKPKKKDQIRLDKEAAKTLQGEFDEEERLVREKAIKEQEYNIVLNEEWNDIQSKIDVDYELAERLQAQEQEELSDAEKATLFQQLLEKRRKHFAAKRAKEKMNKPPTKSQQRKIMFTYLKNMEGYKLNDLKLKEFDSIKEMFDRAFRRANTFVDYITELVKGKEKRAGEELVQKSTKKQKVEDDKEKDELKELMETILDEEEVVIDDIHLAVKSSRIVDWKIHKEGKKSYYQIIRAGEKS